MRVSALLRCSIFGLEIFGRVIILTNLMFAQLQGMHRLSFFSLHILRTLVRTSYKVVFLVVPLKIKYISKKKKCILCRKNGQNIFWSWVWRYHFTQKAIRDGIPPPNKLITMLKLLTPFALLKLYNEYIAYTAFTPCNAHKVTNMPTYTLLYG